jgi:hypothetical protein
MRQAEEHCGGDERGIASAAPVQKILQPAAEKQLLGRGDKEKGEEKCTGSVLERGQSGIGMENAETQANGVLLSNRLDGIVTADDENAQAGNHSGGC